MFLKRLEIQGFKSFPEKIRLEFKSGITGVVGPNGSGKSNISDAIRWVLGEQSAKTLRGDKMEDIIFAGTKNRKPLGFAEVSMVLDNTDKKLNLDYTEITITRKVYRSGESGYFINGASCRLKDIHELFMDTGIGKEGYSLIGQGKIDAILSNKTEDRRALFEEAVGIVKFKNRRVQTENRLEEVRKNLTRTNDLITELERQIKPLEEQRGKAKEFLEISKGLKITRVNLFKEEYGRAEKNINRLDSDISILIENTNTLENQKEQLIKNQENFKIKLLEKETEIGEFNETFSVITGEIDKNQNEISLKRQSIEYTRNDIARIQNEQEKNIQNINKRQEEINLINSSIKAKELEYGIKQKELEGISKEFEEFARNLSTEEEDVKKVNADIVKKMELVAKISNQITVFDSNKTQFENKNLELAQQMNVFKSRLNERNTRKAVLSKKIDEVMQEQEQSVNNIHSLNTRLEELYQNINISKSKQADSNRKHMELKNRHKILSELEKDHEGYFGSIKAILKERESNPKFSGLCGAVGELISVPKEYETAMEIALGGAIQNVITKTEEDAKIAINYLKQTKKGRATFLPITSIKSKTINEKVKIIAEKGVIGIGDELIKFDISYKNILSSLLGRVIIIDNLDNAITLSKKYSNSYKMVTLDGDIINAGGALTGGSIQKKAAGIFSRGREIGDISDKLAVLEEEIKILNENIEIKTLEKNDISSKIEIEKTKINDMAIEKTKLLGELEQIEIYIEETQSYIKNTIQELNNLEAKLEGSSTDLHSLQDELFAINEEIEGLKSKATSYESRMQQGRNSKDGIINNINRLKMDIKDIEYTIQNGKNQIVRIETEILSTQKQNKSLDVAIEEKEQENTLVFEEIELINKEIEGLKEKHLALKNKSEMLQKEKLNINNSIENTNKDVLSTTMNIAEVQNEKVRLDNKKENIETRIELLTQNMWEEYGITYASASNDYEHLAISYDELKQEEVRLKKKIASLGSVNVSAIEEYKIVKERYDLNIQQREDILKADDDLKDIIATLINEMEYQFKEQFHLINDNFGKVFSDIFGGGTARLTLTDEENILTSGIDIVAQPPGKNLQSLTLLSGGERTLTAMSLLFAILRLKPSPFCILDETEAALDDANVTRYANFLKKFSGDNQFILITHKTGTMEIADTLYGVTMEEQGVSKVISVELKDAKGYNNS